MKNSKQSLIDFVALIQNKAPNGTNSCLPVPVLVGTNMLCAIVYKVREEHIFIALFLSHKAYPRKTIIISAEGVVTEGATHSIFPDDKAEVEPDFSGITAESIALTVASEVTAALLEEKMFVQLAENPATHYMSSIGNARHVLITQYQYPFLYDVKNDKIKTGWIDTVEEMHRKKCLAKFGISDFNADTRIPSLSRTNAFAFICMLLEQDQKNWTGFRILGGILDNGHSYFSFSLFKKGDASTTLVYSNRDAPNVERVRKIDKTLAYAT